MFATILNFVVWHIINKLIKKAKAWKCENEINNILD